MIIEIPYGKEIVKVNVPDSNVGEIIYPNPVKIDDEEKLLRSALENPIDSPKFGDFVGGGGKILIIVNDATRPTPTAKILDMLYDDLKGKDIKFIVATGVHRVPTKEEYYQIFGKHYDEWKDIIIAHESKKYEDMVYIGKSKNGTEMYVNKLGMEADKIVIIGSVEPHYFAGYTGGRKAFLPGIASYKTIEQNHKFALSPDARSLKLEGNPCHEDMIDALKTIENKQIFSIMTVLDRKHRLYAVTAGNIHSSFYAAIDKANEVFAVKIKDKADIVVSIAPFPMDIDLYQSQKAIDNGKLALKENGILIMVSKCRTGTGPETFIKLLSSSKSPKDALEKIDKEFKLGYHKAAKMAEVMLWADIWAVTDLSDDIISSIFIKPFHSIQMAIDKALEIKGKDAKIHFLMDGSITVPLIAQ